MKWKNLTLLAPLTYTCGHIKCGREVDSSLGWELIEDNLSGKFVRAYIYICPICQGPTSFYYPLQIPGNIICNKVEHLPTEIDQLYEEIRKATAQQAYTASVLARRKLLMHIAVEKGAEENKNFTYYVNYLE